MKPLTRNILYALAAVLAGYLPLAYICMVICVLVSIFMGIRTGSTEGPFLWWGWQITFYAIYATFIQWPFYLVWALISFDLSRRQRIAWVVVILLFNMFAMPYFLGCKYVGRSRQGLLWFVRKPRLKQYLEG